MAAYVIYADRTEDEASGNYGFANDILDGDFKSAFPVGIEFHPKTRGARLEDGTRIRESAQYQGLPVDMSGLPKRVRWGGGKRPLVDLLITQNHFLVSEKLQDAIEALESGVHQFQSTKLIWQDDSLAATYFWLNVCNRRDAMDREYTTYSFDERTRRWNLASKGKFVVSLSQTAGAHIWVDSCLTTGTIFVSEGFKIAMTAAGITGIGYSDYETV